MTVLYPDLDIGAAIPAPVAPRPFPSVHPNFFNILKPTLLSSSLFSSYCAGAEDDDSPGDARRFLKFSSNLAISSLGMKS